jgi:hypothetical protein
MSRLTNKSDAIKQQILLNISDDSFIIHHTDTMDILDVYLVLVAAIEYIEEEATGLAKHEGKYLQ